MSLFSPLIACRDAADCDIVCAFMPRLTVSFCVPTHRRTQFLVEALESGLAQTRPPDEIVVSDDTGSAETRALVDEVARRAPFPVRYVHCTTGQSQVHNMNNC